MKIVRRGPYARIVFREFKPGEIFDLVTRVNGRPGRNRIIDIGDAFTLPDAIAGIVEYGSERRGTKYLPFIGENVIEKMGGRKLGTILIWSLCPTAGLPEPPEWMRAPSHGYSSRATLS